MAVVVISWTFCTLLFWFLPKFRWFFLLDLTIQTNAKTKLSGVASYFFVKQAPLLIFSVCILPVQKKAVDSVQFSQLWTDSVKCWVYESALRGKGKQILTRLASSFATIRLWTESLSPNHLQMIETSFLLSSTSWPSFIHSVLSFQLHWGKRQMCWWEGLFSQSERGGAQ